MSIVSWKPFQMNRKWYLMNGQINPIFLKKYWHFVIQPKILKQESWWQLWMYNFMSRTWQSTRQASKIFIWEIFLLSMWDLVKLSPILLPFIPLLPEQNPSVGPASFFDLNIFCPMSPSISFLLRNNPKVCCFGCYTPLMQKSWTWYIGVSKWHFSTNPARLYLVYFVPEYTLLPCRAETRPKTKD